jgi:hypothetical protein
VGRGRPKSITNPTAPLIPGQRLPPPAELSPAQSVIWDRVIGGLPQNWVTAASEPLAVQLCRHVDFANRLCRDIEAARSELEALADEPADGLKAEKAKATRVRKARAYLLSLTRMHLSQTSVIGLLSTKLRLSKSSQFTRSAESAAIAARSVPSVKPPWEWDGQQ